MARDQQRQRVSVVTSLYIRYFNILISKPQIPTLALLLLGTASLYINEKSFSLVNQHFKQLTNSEQRLLNQPLKVQLSSLKENEARQNSRIIDSESMKKIYVKQQLQKVVDQKIEARYQNGTLGYIANVKAIRKRIKGEIKSLRTSNVDHVTSFNYLPMSKQEYRNACKIPPNKRNEQEGGFEILTEVVQLHKSNQFYDHEDEDPPPTIQNEDEKDYFKNTNSKTRLPKILCSIYTIEENHYKIEAITETWGWRCDGFLAASNATNETVGAVNLTHKGPEAYGNMWQKTRSILAYIHDHYLEDFDFFWIGGDDVYMLVENMKYYLWNMTTSIGIDRVENEPLYLGARNYLRDKDVEIGKYFVSGGPGYILNRYALKEFVSKALPTCFVNQEVSMEDRMMSNCLRDIGITGNHTVDEENRQIFHSKNPRFLSTYNGVGMSNDVLIYNRLWKVYGHKTGKDIVSRHSVTFHHVKDPLSIKRYHAILYKICPLGTIIGDRINNLEYS